MRKVLPWLSVQRLLAIARKLVSSQEQSLSANSHCLQFLWVAWCSGKVFLSTNVEVVANHLLNLELSKIQAKQTAQPNFFLSPHYNTIVHSILCTCIFKASVRSSEL